MKDKFWKTGNTVLAYNFAVAGMRNGAIAGLLGVNIHIFNRWVNKRKEFKFAVNEGRKSGAGSRTEETLTFSQYVYKRLPDNLKELWDKINAVDTEKTSLGAIEVLLKDQGVRARQYMFIHAWISSNFSVSKAMRRVGLCRDTWEKWKKNDPEFGKLCDEILWHRKNFLEDKLFDLVKKGDAAATIYANKTINRDRGMNERSEVDVNVSGNVNVNVVNVSELELPVKMKKELFSAIEKRRALVSNN